MKFYAKYAFVLTIVALTAVGIKDVMVWLGLPVVAGLPLALLLTFGTDRATETWRRGC